MSGGDSLNSYLEGAAEVERLLEQYGKAPAKVLTTAVKSGAKVMLQDARANAPVKTGALRRGIKLIAEKRKTGKKVYQIVFDRKYNSIFQKKDKNGDVIGYYPASQEYGSTLFGRGFMPGKFFMKKAFERNKAEVERMILDTIASELRRLGGS